MYQQVDAAAAAIAGLAAEALTEAGVPFRLQEAGNLFSFFLGVTGPVRDFGQARAQSGAAYAAFFHAMLDGGVYLPPSPYEAWFVSAAHDDRPSPGSPARCPRRRGPRPPRSRKRLVAARAGPLVGQSKECLASRDETSNPAPICQDVSGSPGGRPGIVSQEGTWQFAA